MLRFLFKIALFSIIPVGTLLGVVLLENGKTDYFYDKVTTPKQKSLILGISKSEQGIIPAILNAKIIDADFYNFSFALSVSPYGKAYYESIKNKIEFDQRNSIFILTIDPWSVASTKEDPNNEVKFEENKNFLGTIPSTTINPNFFYLKDYFSKPFFEIILRNLKSGYFTLHDDGWLEVNITDEPKEKESRIRQRIFDYQKRNKHLVISDKRFEYFEKTIDLLKKQGKVFVVRLPVDKHLIELENKYETQFNQKLQTILAESQLDYLDFTKSDLEKWSFTDGIHLEKSSAVIITEEIGDWILSLN